MDHTINTRAYWLRNRLLEKLNIMAKNCINPKCDKEIPSSATFCLFCGTQQIENEDLSEEEKLRREMSEMQKTIQLLKKALADAQNGSDSSAEDIQVIENLQKQLVDMQNKNKALRSSLQAKPPKKESNSFPTVVLIVGLVLLFIVGLIGYLVVYKPYAVDHNAPRFYTFASNTFLRSSKVTGVDYNKLATVPYGSELIAYKNDYEWTDVKWENPQTGKSIKGYISSDFILPTDDFQIMNSIWGDNESKEVINMGRYRIALFNYFKEKGYAGSWQVFSKSKGAKSNTTYYAHIIDKNSKFVDFAVIIKNKSTSNRKCLLFSFDDDETPRLIYEETAPEIGDIASISYNTYIFNIQYHE